MHTWTVPIHFIPYSLHFWYYFIPKGKKVFTSYHSHFIPGTTSYQITTSYQVLLHTKYYFIQKGKVLFTSSHSHFILGTSSYHVLLHTMNFFVPLTISYQVDTSYQSLHTTCYFIPGHFIPLATSTRTLHTTYYFIPGHFIPLATS